MTPKNLVHAALAERDSRLLTSPDGKHIQVSLEAICKLLDDPPPMVKRPSRNDTIEQCARVADAYASIHGEYIAAAIRALKDGP